MAADLPAKVDLRDHLTEVEEQVGSSCVANAFAGAYEYLAKRELGDAGDVSRLFIYYNARLVEGDESEDNGTEMDAAIRALKKYGACNETFWPNDEDSITEEPPEEAYGNAENFKITSSAYIETDLTLWKHTLAEGSPIAFALNTFESFDDATRKQGRVPFPRMGDNVRETHGWHAMLCVGYLDKDEMFIVRNSWGTEWGDRGYCYIPYKYILHDDFNGHDSWIIKGVSDLDFSKDIWSEDTDSYFSGEGSLQAFDFTCRTDDVEGFAVALESLCDEHSTDEGFYFDYDTLDQDGEEYAEITNLDIAVEDGAAFEQALHDLCNEWAGGDDYDFTLESADDSDADESSDDQADDESEDTDEADDADESEDESDDESGEDESDDDESEDDESEDDESEDNESDDDESEDDESDETVDVSFSEFWIYTDDVEGVVAKVDKVCVKFAAGGDDYGYEYAEDSDDGGNFVGFTDFIVTTDDSEGFLAALEALCEKVSEDGGYSWTLDDE